MLSRHFLDSGWTSNLVKRYEKGNSLSNVLTGLTLIGVLSHNFNLVFARHTVSQIRSRTVFDMLWNVFHTFAECIL